MGWKTFACRSPAWFPFSSVVNESCQDPEQLSVGKRNKMVSVQVLVSRCPNDSNHHQVTLIGICVGSLCQGAKRGVEPAPCSHSPPQALQHCTDEQKDAEKFSLRLLILGLLCWKSSLLTKHWILYRITAYGLFHPENCIIFINKYIKIL